MAAAARLDDVALDVGAPTAPASKPGVDLEWQTFSSTQLPTAAAPAVAATTSPRPAQPSTAAAAAAVAAGQDGDVNPLMCFTPSFWKQSFDVTTADVRTRIRMAAWPLEPTSFLSTVGARVDLYGPIWLCATLVFVIAAGSSLNSFFAFTSSSSTATGGAVGGQLASIWKYDFKTITLALMTVYGYFAGAATGAWLGASYLGIPSPSLVQLVCIYGYSVTPFIPAAVSGGGGGQHHDARARA